ncbi:flagellar assembly protein FliW [Treponema phagedenis]|uniref:Flagellar assembly factor FliW n=1 Tax=Treponema phagedenis TaxID=162 RepID=A0A0B7GXC3_TREPH|nr:flagellar assembly protein FliW [Treponema phagedenis]EFW36418.1 flagellar assembly factor FliW [Treponema phagedenis F0421]NVP22948.1 flagellar assembly protein FliW [Treponema phagedenis]QEJ95069.1 flagellar assembly protein FliW [Treponema phagedenis]QEJ98257.1 flagellar assembly protein FliW [Treponema phagedenis]QEK00994.1 flagellar assembly protein FliW [Treponema phagedenis]
MELKTKTLGTVHIEEDQIITLDQGFYGFENYHRFALIDAEQPPFIRVQSIDNPDLSFIAIDPFLFRADYEVDIDDSLLAPLGIESPTDVLIFALVTIPRDGSAVTANLQGPLIINKKNKKAMQAVVSGDKWTTKHDIVAELSKKRGSSC